MAKARPVSDLKCDADAAAGARLVLMSRVHEMISLRDKAFDWSDPEGVHDMRVASRRLRSALRDFGSLFPKRDLVLLGRESKVFADNLGNVRDEDVAIIELEKLRLSVSSEARAGLELLIVERDRRRHTARINLTKKITAQRLTKLLQLFTKKINVTGATVVANKSTEREAVFTFRDLGRERIGKQFKRFGKRAVCLYSPLASDELHELRIEAKRLRYALELFGICWNDKLTLFSEQIAEMQGALGDLHDYDVWINVLGNKLVALHDHSNAGKEAHGEPSTDDVRKACVWLLDHFTKERTKSYRQALGIWTGWQASAFASRLNTVLAESVRNI